MLYHHHIIVHIYKYLGGITSVPGACFLISFIHLKKKKKNSSCFLLQISKLSRIFPDFLYSLHAYKQDSRRVKKRKRQRIHFILPAAIFHFFPPLHSDTTTEEEINIKAVKCRGEKKRKSLEGCETLKCRPSLDLTMKHLFSSLCLPSLK